MKLLNHKPFFVSTKFTRKAYIGQNCGAFSFKLQITVRIEWATWMKLTERRRRETQNTKRGTSGKDL